MAIKWTKRLIYSIVGLTGVSSAVYGLMNLSAFPEMGIFGSVLFSVSTIGALNWGSVALSGDERNNLLTWIGLK